jgi:hypothetical protein
LHQPGPSTLRLLWDCISRVRLPCAYCARMEDMAYPGRLKL